MAAGEVASLAVHIFPEMKGFRAKMMSEAEGAGKESGSLFARIFSSSGKQAGEKAGQSLRNAFQEASRTMPATGLDKVNAQIKKITHTVSSEHLKMLDAQGKVRVAQAKLNDTVAKYGKDSTQALAAQERLNSAQRKADELTSEYKAAIQQLKSAQADRNELEKAYAPATYRKAIADVEAYGKAVKETLAESSKASRAQVEAQRKLEEAVSKYGQDSKQAAKAQQALAQAQEQTNKAEGAHAEALRKLTEAQERANKAAKDYQPPKLNGFQQAIENVRGSLSKLDSIRLNGLHGAFQKAGEAGESLKEKISAGTVALGTAIGSAVTSAASTVKDFAQECMSEYNEASEGIAKFNQIAANNHWSEEQKASLDELSESLMHVGVIDDDVTRAGQAQLGTFKLSAQAVKELTPAMDDMIAHTKGLNATGEDAVTIGNLMGKVMTGQVGALQRYGVTMDANQKKLLQHGTAEQRAATLAKVLEENYGGVNKALAQTPAGKMKQLQLNIEDLKKSLGKSFTTVVGAIAPLFTQGLDKARKPIENFAKWFSTAVKGISQSISSGNVSKSMQQAFGVNAGPILDGLKGIRDGFKAAFGAITGQAGKAGKSLGDAKNHVSPLAQAFKDLGSAARVAGKLVAVIAPHFKTIATVIMTAVAAFKVYKTTVTAVTIVNRIFNTTLAANPIGAIVTAIALVVAGLILLEKKFHIFSKAGAAIQKAWGAVGKFFSGLWNGISRGAQKIGKDIGKHFNDACKGAQKAWNGAGKWFQNTGKNIANGFNGMKKDIGKHFNDAWKGAQKAWHGAGKWFQNTGKNVINGFKNIKNGIGDHFKRAQEGAQKAWRATPSWFRNSVAGKIIEGYASMPGKIIGFFQHPAQSAKAIWNGVTGFFTGLPGRIAGFFGSLPGRITGFFRSAGDGVKNVWNGVVGWFGGLPGRIVGFFQSIPSQMGSIGANIINGLINGIRNNIGNVAQAITGGMKSAINGVKHFLGIHSPSTVMRDQVGQFIGLGLASGIRQSMPAVSDAMVDMAGIPATTTMSLPGIDGGQLAVAATSAGNMPVTRDDIMRLTDAVESLHRDLGPTINRWTPTMSGRERARVVRDALAGRY